METVIVICLLVVIVLLMQDKIVINKSLGQQQPKQAKVNPDLPDIMGQPKAMRSLSFPNSANERQIEGTEINPDNLDIEYDENESAGIQIPQEELDEVFSTMPDLEDEEEEWHRYGISGSNDNLAQGVTYDELSSVGALLQKENLKKAQKETAIAIVQKIQGTELFSLLENSIEGASRKIAMLLDSSLPETDSGSSSLRKNDLGDFDIGEFV
jgi:hypothetical protein